MTFWNSEKLSNFEAHELSWTVNELCTLIPKVPSLCPPMAHIFILLQSLAPKWKTSDKKTKKTHTHTRRSDKTTEIRNIKL